MISRESLAFGKCSAVCVCSHWLTAAPTAWKNFRNHWFYSILTKFIWTRDVLTIHQQRKPGWFNSWSWWWNIDAACSGFHRPRWRAAACVWFCYCPVFSGSAASKPEVNNCTAPWKAPWLWTHSTSTRRDGIRRPLWDDWNTSLTSRTLQRRSYLTLGWTKPKPWWRAAGREELSVHQRPFSTISLVHTPEVSKLRPRGLMWPDGDNQTKTNKAEDQPAVLNNVRMEPSVGVCGALQGWDCPPRNHRAAAPLCQEALRLGLPPRHGRPHEPHRPHVLPGPWRHGHHGLHAAVLQVPMQFYRCPPAAPPGSFHRLTEVFLLSGQFLRWCSGSGWISPSTRWSTTPTVTLLRPSLPSKKMTFKIRAPHHQLIQVYFCFVNSLLSSQCSYKAHSFSQSLWRIDELIYLCFSLRQIGVAYITATSTALATAVGLNLYTKVQNCRVSKLCLHLWWRTDTLILLPDHFYSLQPLLSLLRCYKKIVLLAIFCRKLLLWWLAGFLLLQWLRLTALTFRWWGNSECFCVKGCCMHVEAALCSESIDIKS